MRVSLHLFLLVVVQLLICKKVCSQGHNITSESLALQQAESVYFKSLGEQSGIYEGPEYSGYPYRISRGHPFFMSSEPEMGDIYYKGLFYKGVPLWYDLVKNEVVVLYSDGFSRVSLHTSLIEAFSIYGHEFIRLRDPELPAGFYDRIYRRNLEVLVKRSKGIVENVSPEGISIIISQQRNDIYLKKNGIWFPITNQASVLKALGNKQKEIKLYLKKNKVKFRQEPEKAIVMMAGYFEELNN